jgi:hypothetical protein
MRPLLRLCLLVTAVATAAIATPFATAGPSSIPLPPFNECPSVGASPSCEILVVINEDRSVSVWQDTSVGPYDGGDDTLVGVLNLSSPPVDAITVAGQGSGLALLDGDGLCTYGVPSCPFGSTGYEGPGTSIVTDPALPDEAEIDFTGGLASNASTYFSLEGALNSAQLTVRQGHLRGIQITSSVSDYPLSSDPATAAFVRLRLTVTDSAGVPIAGATVTTTSLTTGKPISFTTNSDGQVNLVEQVQPSDLTLNFSASSNGESASTSVTLYHVTNFPVSCTFDGAPNRLSQLGGLLQFLIPGGVGSAVFNWIAALDAGATFSPSQVQTHVAAQKVTGSGLTPLYVLYASIISRSSGRVLSSSSLYSHNIHLTDPVTGSGASPIEAMSRAWSCGVPAVPA